ncbi:MAG: hypothetical protein QOJ12_3066 [Thermoleophilales bacterium]|jgi:hypothetical protein|nr:hypothetical protein [Thermoleophilales bacterium]
MLAASIRENADRLEALAHTTIADPEVVPPLDEAQGLDDSLLS